jgi:hypothetical protein
MAARPPYDVFFGQASKGDSSREQHCEYLLSPSVCLLIIMHVHDSLSVFQFLSPMNMGHSTPQSWKLYQWIFALLAQVRHQWMM